MKLTHMEIENSPYTDKAIEIKHNTQSDTIKITSETGTMNPISKMGLEIEQNTGQPITLMNGTVLRFETLARTPQEGDFWNLRNRVKHKPQYQQRSPQKRRRSIEEGELEEERTFRGEKRDRRNQ
ncbi:Hypothetical predicted protein [Pelobates cultripes]|uniref:Uncharacterized protein n=1 Tax=Pelobates cultripes TaxID=61616 RepID=A0AAD1TD09_PELCU|nr:Hypothetical predicted protein [Pelobates cultripes]